MTFDKLVPPPLKKTQQWFASIITRPIDEDNRMIRVSPTGIPMEQEAPLYITPNSALRSDERIQIYNQQYWWRLLTNMQEGFPFLSRLFGFYAFNQMICFPYLQKYPPNHWSLNALGDRLCQWIEEEYTDNDKTLIYNVARVDWAFGNAFVAAALEMAEQGKSNQKLCLQPYVHLFELPYDLFQLRKEFMKQEHEYWLNNEFPILIHHPEGKSYYFVLYRDRFFNIDFLQIEQAEFRFLRHFQEPATIEEACDWVGEQDEAFCDEAAEKIQEWFHHWAMRQWLGISKRT